MQRQTLTFQTLAVVLTAGIFCSLLHAQPPPERVTVRGMVLDDRTEQPVAGAQVTLSPRGEEPEAAAGRDRTAETDEAGRFELTVDEGDYRLSVTAAGYRKHTQDLALRGSQPAEVNVRLQVAPGIRGHLRREDGTPLANAEFTVWLDGELHPEEKPNRPDSVVLDPGWQRINQQGTAFNKWGLSLLGVFRTESDGSYRFTIPWGIYAMRVHATGFQGDLQREVVVAPGKEGKDVDFTLIPGKEPYVPASILVGDLRESGAVAGRITLPDGTPLANAEVQVFAEVQPDPDVPMFYRDTLIAEEKRCRTGPDGSYIRRAVRKGRNRIRVKAREYTALVQNDVVVEPFETTNKVDFQLRWRSSSLTGQVVSQERVPLAGAQVVGLSNDWGTAMMTPSAFLSLLASSDPAEDIPREAKREDIPFTTTDDQGRYTLEDLTEGVYHIGIYMDGFVPHLSNEVSVAAETQVTGIDFRLTPLGSLTGTVYSPEGKPLARTEVLFGVASISEYRETQPRKVMTNDQGHYRLDGLQAGQQHLPMTVAGFPSYHLSAEVQAGKTTTVDVHLEAGHTLHGQVVREDDGAPVNGATVKVKARMYGIIYEEEQTVTTDAQGRFAFENLPSGWCDVVASVEGLAPSLERGVMIPRDGEPAEVSLKLNTGATLTGRVTSENGTPLAGIEVRWYCRSDDWINRDKQKTTTDEDGQFEFTHLPPGAYHLYASPAGYGPINQEIIIPRRKAAVKCELTPIALPEGTLRGRVLRPDGEPALGARIWLYPWQAGAGARQQTQTGIDGSFIFPNTPAVLCSLKVAEPGYPVLIRPDVLAQEARESLVTLQLLAAGSLRGQVAAPDGRRPTGDITVEIVRVGSRADWIRRHLRRTVGRFIYATEGESPCCQLSHHRTFGQGIEVVEIPDSASIFLYHGPPGPGVPEQLSTQVDAEGNFAFEKLPPAAYNVWAIGDFADPADLRVEVKPGQTTDVLLNVTAGGAIVGRVENDRGEPLEGTEVWVEDSDGRFLKETRTAADGTFRLEHLRPGDFTLYAWHEGLAPVRQVGVKVEEGEEVRCNPRLSPGVTLSGRVLGPDGLPPVYTACVSALGPGWGGASCRPDGTYTIEHLTPGTYDLTVWGNGAEEFQTRPGVAVGAEGTTDVDFTLTYVSRQAGRGGLDENAGF